MPYNKISSAPSSPCEFGSFYNSIGETIKCDCPLPFSHTAAERSVSIDVGRTDITLGAATYYRLTLGVNISGFSGTTAVELCQNGVGSGIYLPVVAFGGSSLNLILPSAPRTVLQFVVRGGSLTLAPGGVNAYASLSAYES